MRSSDWSSDVCCSDLRGPPAVVEGEGEGHSAVAGGHGLGVVDVALHPLRHPPALATDEPNSHALAVELVAAGQQQSLVEAHEEAHLVDRATPVLSGEGVDGEPSHAELQRALDGIEERLLPQIG